MSKRMSPYEYSYWIDEIFGYNAEVTITNNDRRLFVVHIIWNNKVFRDGLIP